MVEVPGKKRARIDGVGMAYREEGEGDPIVSAYAAWLPGTDFPKLFVNAEPGALMRGGVRDFVRGWRNVSEVTVPGVHFLQEDSPDEIGAALKEWIGGTAG